MKRKISTCILAICFIFTLFVSDLWIMSLLFYTAVIFAAFKIDRSDRKSINMFYASICTAVICCILLSFDRFFTVGCYLIAVMIAMTFMSILTARDKHEGWKNITVYIVTSALFIWVVSQFFVNASMRIRKEKFNKYPNQQQEEIR